MSAAAFSSEVARAIDALEFLTPPLERDAWVKLLMAAHDAGVDEDAARAWSERGENFDAADFRATWRSIKPGGGIGAGTLIRAAVEAGWRAPQELRRMTAAACGAYEAEIKERRAAEAAAAQVRHEKAAERALAIWNAARECAGHPYLERKGVQSHGLRVGRWEKWDAQIGAMRFIENVLLIPIRDAKKRIRSLQAIFADADAALGRDRDFLAGGEKSGNFFTIGKPVSTAENPNPTIAIAEGYASGASIHEVTGHAVVIAFDKSNLLAVAKVLRQKFPTADLVIFSDRDAELLSASGGTKAALLAALETNARIVVPEWRDATPGRDANDIALHGLEVDGERFPGREIVDACVRYASPPRSPAFLELLRDCGIEVEDLPAPVADAQKPRRSGANTAPSWGAPVDLFSLAPPPQIPLHLLPGPIARYAADQGELMGCDPSVIAMAALAAVASCIHDGLQIQPKRFDPTWRESARLWVAVIGSPSSKKSPGIAKAVHPVRTIDAARREVSALEHARHAEQHAEWRLAAKKRDGDAPPEPKVPPSQRALAEDTTVEALGEILRDNPQGLLVVRDELTGWLGSMDAYRGAKGAASQDRAHWLELYNGGGRVVDRVTRGSISIPNWSACLVGGIQPDMMRRVAAGIGHDGLLQRFIPIVAHPAESMGVDRSPDMEGLAAYRALFDQLVATQPGHDRVKLSEGAHLARERVDAFASRMGRAIGHVGMEAWLGKWPGLFARLLLVFHVVECAEAPVHPASRQVSAETAEKVERLMCGALLPHAISFYSDVIDQHDRQENARDLARLILARGWQVMRKRDLQRSWKLATKLQAWELHDVVSRLCDMGWLEPDREDSPGSDGKPRTWFVNPNVHAVFADHAERERRRRAEVTQTLRELKASHHDAPTQETGP